MRGRVFPFWLMGEMSRFLPQPVKENPMIKRHKDKEVIKRRKKNKIARSSRKKNRRR